MTRTTTSGKAPAPSTGIVDSQSVTSGPQKGERGVDGNKKVRGIKRHVLTCSFGFVLAVLVSAANLHDTHGLEPLLERFRPAVLYGFDPWPALVEGESEVEGTRVVL